MADTTDVSKLPTDGPAVNSPASGAYGEGAALERLRAQLPGAPAAGASGPTPASPMPLPPTGGGVSNRSTGLPQGLFMPTQRPDVPVSTPLAAPPVSPLANAQTSRQRNLAILTAILNDPRSSEVTKDFAQTTIDHLIQGSKA